MEEITGIDASEITGIETREIEGHDDFEVNYNALMTAEERLETDIM